jgi:hypothetical protein
LLYPLQPVHAGGLFEAVVAAEAGALCATGLNATEHGRSPHVRRSLRDDVLDAECNQDCHLFAEGNHYQIYENLGAHLCAT